MNPKDVVTRFVEEFQSKGDVSVAEELIADDFVNHSPPPGMPATREAVIQFFVAMHDAFPDFRAVIHDQLCDGDKVVTRKTFHGTHQAPFLGIPPTGREVTIGVIDIVRVSGGRIAEHWNEVDQLGMMQQLGVIPG